MSNTWTLGGVSIKAPHQKSVSEQVASNIKRVLSGSYYRDFIGAKKKVVTCQWSPIDATDLATILAAYNSQVATGANVALVVSATDFAFSGNVLIDIGNYDFTIPNQYSYSDFQVTFYEQ